MSNNKQKPTICIGFYNLPIATANFMTSKEGGNEIADEFIKFCTGVYQQVTHKLIMSAQEFNAAHGVDTVLLTPEEVLEYTKQIVGNASTREGEVVVGIITPEGKVIEDEHAVENLVSGKRFDN